eukprot:CAMPEP_0173087580 /NCGR_PEP_ID=MMETSP1102-20130122/24038_1 /TAXON_ID=49646 /ORGANISM="Geminigera sp., Strain Caron Lab Isolate" /LENGTH=62 /DNA_ID=CAMNT_0013969549 /DNA_START=61 /DNA_END=246 /DNA_ORIENTATION=-
MEKYEIEAIPVTKVAGKSTRPAALLLAALMPMSRVMHANTMKMNSSRALPKDEAMSTVLQPW